MLRKIIALLFIALLLFFIVQSARLVLRVHQSGEGADRIRASGPFSALSAAAFGRLGQDSARGEAGRGK